MASVRSHSPPVVTLARTFLLSLSLLACGGDSPPAARGGEAAGASGAAGAGGAAGKAGSAGNVSADPCAEDTDVPAAGAVCLGSVRGNVVDLGGAPVTQKLVTVCGVACFYGKTDATGAFVTPIGARLLPREYVVFVHGGPTHATLLVELAGDAQGPEITLDAPLRVPALPVDGPALPADAGPGGVVASGGLSLTIAPNTTVELDIEDVALGDAGRRFRAVRVEAPDLPPFAKEMGGVFAFAIAPFDAVLSLPAAFTIDGTSGLAAGQKVEIFAQEDDFTQEPSGLGKGRVIATGHVSSDGKQIVPDGGVGLSRLSWLGVRAAL